MKIKDAVFLISGIMISTMIVTFVFYIIQLAVTAVFGKTIAAIFSSIMILMCIIMATFTSKK